MYSGTQWVSVLLVTIQAIQHLCHTVLDVTEWPTVKRNFLYSVPVLSSC